MIVHRFATGIWPECRGEIPFIATGPRFKSCTGSPDRRFKMQRLSARFIDELDEAHALKLADLPAEEAKLILAQALLEEQIIVALWLVGSPVPQDDRLAISIRTVADKIPDGYWGTLSLDTAELLDGMSSAEHYHSLLSSHDDGELEPQLIVV